VRGLKRLFIAIFALALIAFPIDARADEKASPVKAQLSIDGSVLSLNAYNIQGYTYFMLRDIAKALSGTKKSFDVTFAQSTGRVGIVTGSSYLGPASDAPQTLSFAVGMKSTSAFDVDGKPASLEAYNIDGRNYLKIRDLAAALGIEVGYDAAVRQITLTTNPQPVDFGYGVVGEFSAKDLSGNTYTNSIFQEKPITFINYWATWCGPCRAELPDFPALYQSYSDKVTFVTVVDDGEGNAYADQLSKRYLSSYLNLLPERNLIEKLQTGYVPTTILVNKDGSLVMEPLIGAYGAQYAQSIDEALKKVGA
jgi:thiol-disulfide isomerase/thioredoxin